jgi:hypothetical protein
VIVAQHRRPEQPVVEVVVLRVGQRRGVHELEPRPAQPVQHGGDGVVPAAGPMRTPYRASVVSIQPRVEASLEARKVCSGDGGREGRPRRSAATPYRTLSVASPISARISEMIQNRITICGSAQPCFSKWWWIGAMRNTRFPVRLK